MPTPQEFHNYNLYLIITKSAVRAKHVKVQYRILYFFHGQNVVILAHAMIKEDNQVSEKDIDLALKYKNLFVLNPEIHTYTEQEEEADEENS